MANCNTQVVMVKDSSTFHKTVGKERLDYTNLLPPREGYNSVKYSTSEVYEQNMIRVF